MSKRIIYQTDNGGVALITPVMDCGLTVEEIARKDVPAGVPFKIIYTVEVPDDSTFRAAWEADMTSPHGTGIGQQAWFIEQYEAEIAKINAETGPAQPQYLVASSIDEAELPEDMTPEDREAAYAELVTFVTATNEQNAATHAEAVAQWEDGKAARIKQLNKQIATQQAEMAA